MLLDTGTYYALTCSCFCGLVSSLSISVEIGVIFLIGPMVEIKSSITLELLVYM